MAKYCAIYDFDLMPYALGDVLTWNVQTAIRCEEAGREAVDVHICLDQRHPSSIYQSDMINADNCWMFFNELFGAFGTHPRLGSIVIHRSREEALERLKAEAAADAVNIEALTDYEYAHANRHDNDKLVAYFTKYIYYHKGINAYAARHGRIPLLQPSMGCGPDVAGLLATYLSGKRLVPVHVRQRRLDAGYGGAHTHTRDSDFLEWYEFLREAERRYPDVQFLALGRLQEKPLELLRLPNVTSLRTLGFGLGHELTLMLRSDLFIGTSSGFAAMANFSALPYYITKMGRESCNAYQIEFGADRLPFATDRQKLIYEPESRDLLLRLLEEGLAGVPPRGPGRNPQLDPAVDVRSWEWERAQWLHPGATTSRYYLGETYRDKETAFLIWPKLRAARAAWRKGWRKAEAWTELHRMETHFPRLCASFPEFLRLRGMLAVERNEWSVIKACQANLERLAQRDHPQARAIRIIRRYLVWGMPVKTRLRYIWKNRRHIPAKLRAMARNLARRVRARLPDMA
jgi:hypothetical protein